MTEQSYWSLRTNRTSRRRLLAGSSAAGIGIAGLALAGCGDDDDSPSPTTRPATGGTAAPSAAATADVKRGGTLKLNMILAANDIWDPHISLTAAGQIWQMVGNQAVHLKTDGSALLPELVEKWEIPGDGTKLILHTRKDANWHNKPPSNGRKFTAEDLAFNINRISGNLNPEKIAQFQRRSTVPNLDRAVALDESTVEVRLTAPHSGFLTGLADFRNNIAPKDFVESGGDFSDATKLVGTGPWTIESWDIATKAVFKPVPNWDQGKPYLDAIEMRAYSDRLSYQASFAKGEVDSFTSPNKLERDALSKLTSNYREEKWSNNVWTHFRFNLARPPLNDERVRRAVFLTIDYKSAMDSFNGAGYWEWSGPLTSFVESIPPAEVAKTQGYNPDTKEADRKTAADLLAAAGFAKGAGLSLKLLPASNLVTSRVYDAAIRAQDDLKRVFPEIKVDIDPPADSVVFSQRQVQANFDIISYSIGGYPDAVMEIEAHYGSKGSRNYGKYIDADTDALIAKATVELDFAKRKQILLDAQKRLLQTMPMVRYATDNVVSTVWYRKQIKGAENYGLVTGTASYDTAFNNKNVWIGTA